MPGLGGQFVAPQPYQPGGAGIGATPTGAAANQAAGLAAQGAQQQFGFNTALQGQQNTANLKQLQEQLAGQQQITGQQVAGQENVAQTAAQASELGPQLQQQRFQTVFPLLSGIAGTLQNQLSGGGGSTSTSPTGGVGPSPATGAGGGPTAISAMQGVAGQPAPLTPLQQAGQLQPGNPISAGPVLNPQQIQQQVNASRAGTDAGAASQERTQSAQLAGRGFGANSPLAALLNAGTQQNALTAGSANEQALRYNAAQGNAAQRLAGQTAQSQQNLGAQAAASARQAPIYGQQNALLQALASMA